MASSLVHGRRFEYVAPEEFPGPYRNNRPDLNQALDYLKKAQMGEAVKLKMSPADDARRAYMIKLAHTYADRRGFNVHVRVRDGWLFIQRRNL